MLLVRGLSALVRHTITSSIRSYQLHWLNGANQTPYVTCRMNLVLLRDPLSRDMTTDIKYGNKVWRARLFVRHRQFCQQFATPLVDLEYACSLFNLFYRYWPAEWRSTSHGNDFSIYSDGYLTISCGSDSCDGRTCGIPSHFLYTEGVIFQSSSTWTTRGPIAAMATFYDGLDSAFQTTISMIRGGPTRNVHARAP